MQLRPKNLWKVKIPHFCKNTHFHPRLFIFRKKPTKWEKSHDLASLVERFNRTLEEHLRKVVSHKQIDWEEHVPVFLMAYRAAYHETTAFSPSKILFGSVIRLPADLMFGLPGGPQLNPEDYMEKRRLLFNEIHERTRLRSKMASNRTKAKYDCRANSQSFKEGDLDLLYNPVRRQGRCSKLQCNWNEPYLVITRLNDVVYRIRSSTNARCKMKVVHLGRLAPYHGGGNKVVRGRTNLGGAQ